MDVDRVTELIRKVSLSVKQSSSDYGCQGLAAGELEATGRIVAAIIYAESKEGE